MRTYNKVIVKVGDILNWEIESWTEHNHTLVTSNGIDLFDGYKCEAHAVIEREIAKLVESAKSMNLTAEIIR